MGQKIRTFFYRVCIVLVILAAFNATRTALFLNSALETTGIVTDIEQSQIIQTTGGRLSYNKSEHTFKRVGEHTKIDTSYVKTILYTVSDDDYLIEHIPDDQFYEVGKEISLLYDPENPQDARVNVGGTLWFGTHGPLLFAVLIFLITRWFGKRASNKLTHSTQKDI